MNDGLEAGAPGPQHHRPDGVDDAAVRAAGKVSEALKTTQQAHKHLYAFDQLTGRADLQLDAAVGELRDAGHTRLAERISRELIGGNVLPAPWRLQVVDDYDGYNRRFQRIERLVREQLTAKRRHRLEAQMKEQRRSQGHRAHTTMPSGSSAENTKE
jgi:hypothetical protein